MEQPWIDEVVGTGALSDMVVPDDLALMEEFLLSSPGFDFPDFLHPGAAADSPTPFSPLLDIDIGPCFAKEPAAAGGVKERLQRALQGIAAQWQAQRGVAGELLVQVWAPTRTGRDRQVLTTCGQPFWLSRRSDRLESYRTVSTTYRFSADEDARAGLGLPGRVFVGRVPEWTPDVRYFTDEEYPRVRHAHYLDVRGSVAMPVFEVERRKGKAGACLGVVELVMTTRKINYNAEMDIICNALQDVDLRTSHVSSIPCSQSQVLGTTSYQAIVPEIMHVLTAVCETHKLPLAQTWIPCVCLQAAKKASRHSDEAHKKGCVSTLDEACYVRDPAVSGFHQASSEHHLFRGEGVVGKALAANRPCFSLDVTTWCKAEYPLSHYAKLFGLRSAVAIPLQSPVRTGSMDLILEFFLPVNCTKSQDQGAMLNSLSSTLQQVCSTLRVVGVTELKNHASPETSSLDEHSSSGGINIIPARTTPVEASRELCSSWIASLVDVQNKGVKGEIDSGLPFGFSKQEDEGFSVVTAGWGTSPEDGSFFPGFQKHQDYEANELASCSSDPSLLNSDKAAGKRPTKMEKTVSLQHLRKHFAGSLKEAAKNLGVCPTTLKRICRQHGINRWPSRKIKKVGRSLKKLQMVIDSVDGADGTVQLTSLYENFTKTTWSETEQKFHLEPLVPDQLWEVRFSSHTSPTYSQSSNSSPCCSSGQKPQQQQSSAPDLAIKQEISMEENQSSTQMKAAIHDELQILTKERPVSLSRFQSHMLVSEQEPMVNMSSMQEAKPDSLKIKAMYGEERCIFRLQPSWGFEKLKEEIAKRFGISQETCDLKYLDDESEWVLLTCDADLVECVDAYKSSSAKTIRISVNQTVQPALGGSFGRAGLS